MKITVCELYNGRGNFAGEWDQLVKHVRTQRSAFVLLPEMPFFPWFPGARHFDARTWSAAVTAHDEWEARLSELRPAIALGTRPVNYGDVRYSAGYWWNNDQDVIETLHVKSRLSSEAGSWETSWYQPAVPDFEVATVGGFRIGMLIGTELWMADQAKLYGEDGAHVIAAPRVDYLPDSSVPIEDSAWLAASRAAARAAGTYLISSTRGARGDGCSGHAWIIAPDGQTLATTSPEAPIVTADLPVAPDTPNERDATPGTDPSAPSS